jgi:hypothetical protein
MELNFMHSAYIAYSYVANVLAQRFDATIAAYYPLIYDTPTKRINWLVNRAFKVKEFGVYQSFGAEEFVRPHLSRAQRSKADAIFASTFQALRDKTDIVAIAIDGVWVGDLVYDTYLMDCKKPTIEKESQDFKEHLLTAIQLFVYWDEYIAINNVRAINVSHCVYTLALPVRIAIKRGIPVFQSNATHVYRMNADNLFAYSDFVDFRRRFAQLPPQVRAAGIREAERRLSRRFAGEVGVDMSYSTKSAYGGMRQERLLRDSPHKKVLIATHCFFDSPHSYGLNLFPDFYEWLECLGDLSNQTNYDWYIKTHPDYLPGTKAIIDSFVARYPRITLLPADSSHHQIIEEGIDVALTTWGSIGLEYAALGIPVVNASRNNPHIAYDFNLHPSNVADYRSLLMDLDHLDFRIDKTQVLEYYFMRYIYNTENWLFDDYNAMIRQIGGYYEQLTPKVYEQWLNAWSPEKHLETLRALERFVDSGDFRLDYTHFEREFSMDATSCDSAQDASSGSELALA